MAAFATNEAGGGSSRFSSSERVTILSMLEEYTNALAIYHSTLKKPTRQDNDILVNCISFHSKGLLTSVNLDKTINTEHAEEDNVPEKLYGESLLYIRKVMENLKEEIREYGTFEMLTNEIERITCHKKEEEALLQQQEELRKTVAELQKIIADEKIVNEEKKKCILYELSEEQRNIKKLKIIADAEEEYVMAREKAKYEQNQLRCDTEIKKLEKMFNDYRVQEKNEERVHVELTKFLIQETALFEEQAKQWEERYVREKEIYEKEICQLRSDIESRQKELEQLKEEYHCNQGFIDSCLAEKEALKKQKVQEERMRKSAVKIQAWWRGIMVRRKLGPYRPKEKKRKRQIKAKK
uniref:dynein regulatory complex protein 9 n=1 Tax=Osmia lignaria TaxID=473952 RepID=UPI00147956B4|nr:dynein regulatory complex protein 9 [Osmia lignaria]XP_034191273.1 dynein regulatory complex protein 9 [Osmia lignaria]